MRSLLHGICTILPTVILVLSVSSRWVHAQAPQKSPRPSPAIAALVEAVTLYASFDEEIRGDLGGGELSISTRLDHPTQKGRQVVEQRIDRECFRISKEMGVHGGALLCSDVLPRRGRLFFPAKGNVAYKKGGWGGALSLWINTDPNRMLTTRYCDPVQITQKGSHNGGIWFDFTPDKPRDLRMGTFPALGAGQKLPKVPEAEQPLYREKNIGFQSGDWHHIAITWENFDTGQSNGQSTLYIDGKRTGQVTDFNLHMDWDLQNSGIYIAVNYIGLLDEFAVFKRPLNSAEVQQLFEHPGLLNRDSRP